MRHSIRSINGDYKLHSIEANINWVDQKWGNQKGSIYLKLFDKNGNKKASLKLFETCKQEMKLLQERRSYARSVLGVASRASTKARWKERR